MRECRLLILVLAGDSFVSNQNLNIQTKTWMKDIPQNVELNTEVVNLITSMKGVFLYKFLMNILPLVKKLKRLLNG